MTFAELEAIIGRTDAIIAALYQEDDCELPAEFDRFSFADWWKVTEASDNDDIVRRAEREMRAKAVGFDEWFKFLSRYWGYRAAIATIKAADGDVSKLVAIYNLNDTDDDTKRQLSWIIAELDRPFEDWYWACKDYLNHEHPLFPMFLWKMGRKVSTFEHRQCLYDLLPDKSSGLAGRLFNEMVAMAEGEDNLDRLLVVCKRCSDSNDRELVRLNFHKMIDPLARLNLANALKVYRVDPRFLLRDNRFITGVIADFVRENPAVVAPQVLAAFDRSEPIYDFILSALGRLTRTN
jgi:hypothetical protein